MNLVSYEYVACQASKKGVLILSEVTKFLLSPDYNVKITFYIYKEHSSQIYYPDKKKESNLLYAFVFLTVTIIVDRSSVRLP